MTTEPRKIEAIECPGFDAVDGTHKTCGQLSRSRERPTIIRPDRVPCDRCRRQKAKYDEANGLRQKREAEEKVRHEGRIAAYVAELGRDRSWTMGNLGSLLEAIGKLSERSSLPPHDQRYRGGRVGTYDQLEILRSLAGVPLAGPPTGRWGS